MQITSINTNCHDGVSGKEDLKWMKEDEWKRKKMDEEEGVNVF